MKELDRSILSGWRLLSVFRDKAAAGEETFDIAAFRRLAIDTYDYISCFCAEYPRGPRQKMIFSADLYDFANLISVMSAYGVLIPGEDKSKDCIATVSQFVANLLVNTALGLCFPQRDDAIIEARGEDIGVDAAPLGDSIFRYDALHGGMRDLISHAKEYRKLFADK